MTLKITILVKKRWRIFKFLHSSDMIFMLSDVNTWRDKASWLSLGPEPWRSDEKPGPRLAESIITSCSSDIVTRCLKCLSSSCGYSWIPRKRLMFNWYYETIVVLSWRFKNVKEIVTLSFLILAVLMFGHAIATRDARSSSSSCESRVRVCS